MTVFSKYFHLRRLGETNFVDIIKIAIMLIATTSKINQNQKIIKNVLTKKKTSVFPDMAKTINFW